MGSTSRTHKVTIRIVAGEIVLDDGLGGQGDLKANTDDQIEWLNETGSPCVIRFQKLKLGNKPGFKGPAWPFDQGSGNSLDIADTKSGGGKVVKAKVSTGRRPCYVKYDVIVAGSSAPPPLDPIIIIDN